MNRNLYLEKSNKINFIKTHSHQGLINVSIFDKTYSLLESDLNDETDVNTINTLCDHFILCDSLFISNIRKYSPNLDYSPYSGKEKYDIYNLLSQNCLSLKQQVLKKIPNRSKYDVNRCIITNFFSKFCGCSICAVPSLIKLKILNKMTDNDKINLLLFPINVNLDS